MKAICKNCKYWEENNKEDYWHKLDTEGNLIGNCKSDKFVYTADGQDVDSDGLGYWDTESYNASFETGRNFGCIHFKQKEAK